MTTVTIIEQPATELLTLASAKSYLKISHTDEDADIQDFIAAARDKIQRTTGYAIGEQTIEWVSDFTKDADPDKAAYLPRRNCYEYVEKEQIPYPPFIDIDTVEKYVNNAWVSQTVTEDYNIVAGYFNPTVGGTYRIVYTAGYDAATLPPGLKMAWKQLVAYLYTNRQDETADIPQYIRYSLQPYKRSLI